MTHPRKEARRSGPQFQDKRADLAVPEIRVLSSYNKQVPIVLGINPAIVVERCRSVCGPYGKLLEDVLNQDTSLSDRVEVSILAIGIDRAICVHHRRVHAPFKAVR